MTEQEFTRLLERYEKGLCTREEQSRLEEWLDSMNEVGRPFESAEHKEVVRNNLHESVYQKAGIPGGKSRSFTPFTWMKVAATLLILILASYALSEFDIRKPSQEIVAEEIRTQDEVQKILLSDGSIIWLKADSKLSYPESFKGKERIVTLEGEALFEISKDPEHPFVIHTGDLTTTVLGTSFNIKSGSDHTEVYVFTGKVLVTLAKTRQKLQLLPTEKITYSHANRQLHKEHALKESEAAIEYTRDTQYNMYFQDTKLSEIATRIEAKFSVKVKIDGNIKSCVITADFSDQSLVNTLDMISEALNVRYQIVGDQVTLKGKGCR